MCYDAHMNARKSIQKAVNRKKCGQRKLPVRETILEYGGVREAREAFDRLVLAGVAPNEIVYILQRVAWWYRPETIEKLRGYPTEIPSYTIKRLPKYLEQMAAPIARLSSYPANDPRSNPVLLDESRKELAKLPEQLRGYALHLREEPKRINKIVLGMRTSCKLEFLEIVKDITGKSLLKDVATLLTAVLVADGHADKIVSVAALKTLQKRRHHQFVRLARTRNTFPSDLAALAAIFSRNQATLVAQLFPPVPNTAKG